MFPMIGGHEGSGIVVEIGDGVTDFAPGDHVVMCFVAVCGQCRWCASGMEYLCDYGAQTGARECHGEAVPPSVGRPLLAALAFERSVSRAGLLLGRVARGRRARVWYRRG
jgi:hypothetical protein